MDTMVRNTDDDSGVVTLSEVDEVWGNVDYVEYNPTPTWVPWTSDTGTLLSCEEYLVLAEEDDLPNTIPIKKQGCDSVIENHNADETHVNTSHPDTQVASTTPAIPPASTPWAKGARSFAAILCHNTTTVASGTSASSATGVRSIGDVVRTTDVIVSGDGTNDVIDGDLDRVSQATGNNDVDGDGAVSIDEVNTPAEQPILVDPAERLISTLGFAIDDLRPIKPRGLINNGNLCFMNAILQPLVHLVPFVKMLQYLQRRVPYSFSSTTPLIDSMTLLINEFSQENVDVSTTTNTIGEGSSEFIPASKGKDINNKPITRSSLSDAFAPEYVYDSLRKRNNVGGRPKGRQEDAEEFLGFLLDGFDEEFTEHYLKPTDSNDPIQIAASAERQQIVLDVFQLLKTVHNKEVLHELLKTGTRRTSSDLTRQPANPWKTNSETGTIQPAISLEDSLQSAKDDDKWGEDVNIGDFTTYADSDRDLATALILSKEMHVLESSQRREQTLQNGASAGRKSTGSLITGVSDTTVTQKSTSSSSNSSDIEEDNEDLTDSQTLLKRLVATNTSSKPITGASLHSKVTGRYSNIRSKSPIDDFGAVSSTFDGDADSASEWTAIGRNNKAVQNRVVASGKSPIAALFCGSVQTTLRRAANSNKSDSITTEPFQTLQLDISADSIVTLEDAFTKMVEPETIQVDSIPTQSNPSRNEIQRQALLDKLPPVLIVNLKRFVYDIKASRTVKLTKFVRYPETLNIDPSWTSTRFQESGEYRDYCDYKRRLRNQRASNSAGNSQEQMPIIHAGVTSQSGITDPDSVDYRLFATVLHHGTFAGGGHYTSNVRRLGVNDWYGYDDEIVKPLTLNEVLTSKEGRHAYMLIYIRPY